MLQKDALEQFKLDRQRARDAGDSMANLCVVANSTTHNASNTPSDTVNLPELRTLVLRDVEGQLAVFINALSPKWPHLQENCSLLTYWPTVQLQFRMQVTTSPVPDEIVRDSWQLRPDATKRMDWFYERDTRQSQSIDNRDTLVNRAQTLDLPDPLQAPESAKGLLLSIQRLERLDLTQTNGIHDRKCWERTTDGWQQTTLVP